MRNPGGWLCITDPDAKRLQNECDTQTCIHCNSVFKVAAGQVARVTWCKQCMGIVCKQCAAKPCRPFEKWLEQHEREGRPRLIF